MAPPSPRESKAPSATSAAKSDEEMVLPGFPDADSFVKVSSRGLRDTGSRPRPAGSRPRTFWQPSARQRAHRSGAPGLGSRRSCPRRAQSHLILQGGASHAGTEGRPASQGPPCSPSRARAALSVESPLHTGKGFFVALMPQLSRPQPLRRPDLPNQVQRSSLGSFMFPIPPCILPSRGRGGASSLSRSVCPT